MLVTLFTSASDWLRRRATSVLLRLVRLILLESLRLYRTGLITRGGLRMAMLAAELLERVAAITFFGCRGWTRSRKTASRRMGKSGRDDPRGRE